MSTIPAQNKPLSKRQIPTLLGLVILVISLVSGLFMFSGGTGVFSPRATPETTPKNVKVTNVSDKSFTVVFYTDENTNGFVKFGTDPESLKTQATDDRDQLSGAVGNYRLHHVTVRNLTPNTTYNYYLGTGSTSRFDNNGLPFVIKTLPAPAGAPPVNKTVYGTAKTQAGGPAEGSVVFVSADGVGEMSTIVKSSGSWAIALSNARKLDGSGYAELPDANALSFTFQGIEPAIQTAFSSTVAGSQPVPEVTIGGPGPSSAEIPAVTATPAEAALPQEGQSAAELLAGQFTPGTPEGSASAGTKSIQLSDFMNNSSEDTEQNIETAVVEAAAEVLDLTKVTETEKPVMVTQPIIKGKAVPNVQVTVEVHSTTQISEILTTDAAGEFTLNIIELQKTLEPGEHTVTFRYTDPTTQQEITRTQSFVVEGAVTQLADTTSPFGSGNPFPLETSPSPTKVATVSVTPATRSAIVSTESGTYKSGSVENTIVLIVGGLFFMFAGTWSWWLAHETRKEEDFE